VPAPAEPNRTRFSDVRIPPDEAVALFLVAMEAVAVEWRRMRVNYATSMFRVRRKIEVALDTDSVSELLHESLMWQRLTRKLDKPA
jgi:hypothetical protein